jgi:hypothetical protein
MGSVFEADSSIAVARTAEAREHFQLHVLASSGLCDHVSFE